MAPMVTVAKGWNSKGVNSVSIAIFTILHLFTVKKGGTPHARSGTQSVLALCHALAQLRSGDWKQFPHPSDQTMSISVNKMLSTEHKDRSYLKYLFPLFVNV